MKGTYRKRETQKNAEQGVRRVYHCHFIFDAKMKSLAKKSARSMEWN
jgi:hypothetical protein